MHCMYTYSWYGGSLCTYVCPVIYIMIYVCHSKHWWTGLCSMLLLMLALGVGLLGGINRLPFPSPPFPSHHPSREAVPLLPFFFTTSSWLPSAGCSARVLSCTIYWWRSLEPMTGSGSTSTLLWDGVSLAFAPLNLQYLCGFRFSVKVLPWDAVQYHTICQEYMCTYIGYCTNVKCLYMGGHVESMAVMGYAYCVSCTISLQLYPGCVLLCFLCTNLNIWRGMFTSLGIPVPFVIISVAARSSLYRIPKSYDTTSPLYSEIRAWVLPRSTPLLLLVLHLYTHTCSRPSQPDLFHVLRYLELGAGRGERASASPCPYVW